MHAFICTACGTQYPPSQTPPAQCPICEDERQYVPQTGQSWTTQEKLALGHQNAWHEYEPGILGLATLPAREARACGEPENTGHALAACGVVAGSPLFLRGRGFSRWPDVLSFRLAARAL